MTTDTTNQTDPLASSVNLMKQLAAIDLANAKEAQQTGVMPQMSPALSTLEFAFVGAYLTEKGHINNHYWTRLFKISTDELQTAHRFVFAINEKSRADLAAIKDDNQERRVLAAVVRIRERAISDIVDVVQSRSRFERRQ